MKNTTPNLRKKALTKSEKQTVTCDMLRRIYQPKMKALHDKAAAFVVENIKTHMAESVKSYVELAPLLNKHAAVKKILRDSELIHSVRGVYTPHGHNLMEYDRHYLMTDQNERNELEALLGYGRGSFTSLIKNLFEHFQPVDITHLHIPVGATELCENNLYVCGGSDKENPFASFHIRDERSQKQAEKLNRELVQLIAAMRDSAFEIMNVLDIAKTPQKIYDAIPESLEFLPTSSVSVGQLIPSESVKRISDELTKAKQSAA